MLQADVIVFYSAYKHTKVPAVAIQTPRQSYSITSANHLARLSIPTSTDQTARTFLEENS